MASHLSTAEHMCMCSLLCAAAAGCARAAFHAAALQPARCEGAAASTALPCQRRFFKRRTARAVHACVLGNRVQYEYRKVLGGTLLSIRILFLESLVLQ